MWKYGIIIVITLLAGVGIGMRWAGGPGSTAQNAGTSTAGEKSEERKIAYWQAPMNPGYRSDKPGKSPMGMDLVPVYEDEVMEEGTVKIDPVTVQNIGVRTATVVRRAMSRRIRTVGRVDYDETRMTDVNTKIAGWVEKLYVDYTGQKVTKGQPLLEIYSPELVAAQEEYLTAFGYHRRLQASADDSVIRGARDLLRAAEQRLLYWDITDAQIAELERSRTVQRRMTIYSPQEGIVVHKAVFNGQHVKPGEHLYRIAELSTVWVNADIYEYELPWIGLGQQATVTLSYLPGKIFTGKVTFIYPYLDPKTRTATVRMIFDNPTGDLKPDMYTDVDIETPVSGSTVIVPVQAVIHSGRRHVVIVSLGEGRFQPRDIVVGVESEGDYQVLEGLKEGEIIVTSSQFLIDSESNLRTAVSVMSSPDSDEPRALATPQNTEGMSHEDMSHEGMSHEGMSHEDTREATSPQVLEDENTGQQSESADHNQH